VIAMCIVTLSRFDLTPPPPGGGGGGRSANASYALSLFCAPRALPLVRLDVHVARGSVRKPFTKHKSRRQLGSASVAALSRLVRLDVHVAHFTRSTSQCAFSLVRCTREEDSK